MAVIEAKRFSVNPADAAEQARDYARQLNIPNIFLANGQEIRFWEWQREATERSKHFSNRTTWDVGQLQEDLIIEPLDLA